MSPEEKAVIEAALYLRYCIDAKTAGDPPRIGRLLDAVDALIFACPECNAGGHTCPGDGSPIGHTQTDCGDHDETHPEPLTGAVAPEWIPAALGHCLAGDRIRIGADETDVVRSSAGIWHADNSDAWHPKAWKHVELRMDVTINPGFQEYPPNLACEILCTPERKATLLLQQAFPGSAVTSSDVD